MQKILYSKETNINDIIYYANVDAFGIPLVLHQNLPRYIEFNRKFRKSKIN